MDDYKKYENECARIRKENQILLDEFTDWLKNKQLVAKTVNSHVSNIDFYINEFLLYEDITEAKDGSSMISSFLGHWFIRKAMWASAAQIKSNASSLKKFYSFMFKKGLISQNGLNELKECIKDDMPEWISNIQSYDEY